RLIVILGAPFDVEDAVWRGTSRRSKDATGVASDGTACSGALITPIRSVHIRGAGDSERRACNPKGGVVHAEGQVAVRPCVSSREGLVIQCDRERKCNRGVAIIAMAADVVHARHERSRVQSKRVVSASSAAATCIGQLNCVGVAGDPIKSSYNNKLGPDCCSPSERVRDVCVWTTAP